MYLVKYKSVNQKTGILMQLKNNYEEFSNVLSLVRWFHENAKFIESFELFELNEVTSAEGDQIGISNITMTV